MRLGAELAYWITPKSGPVRPLRTLRDANRAMLDDLPFDRRMRRHWLDARFLLLAAADSGDPTDLRVATGALLIALEAEGWMSPAGRGRDARLGGSPAQREAFAGPARSDDKSCASSEPTEVARYPFDIAAE